MNSFKLLFEFKFAFFPPFFRGFEFEKRTFRISGVKSKVFTVVDLKTIDPNVYFFLEILVDRGEICNFLVDNEPWEKKKLSRSINLPYPDSLISAARDQLINLPLFANKPHIQYTSIMPNYCLKAWIWLYILGLPKFDGPIRRRRDNDIQRLIIDFSVYYFSNFSLVTVRRFNLT